MLFSVRCNGVVGTFGRCSVIGRSAGLGRSFLLCFYFRLVVTNCTTNRCPGDGVVTCDVPGHSTDRSPLHAAGCIRQSGTEQKRCNRRQKEMWHLHITSQRLAVPRLVIEMVAGDTVRRDAAKRA